MSVPFDGYYTWLGIPPAEQPPHYYRLLGLQTFEANADVIENAADRQMRHVRSFQSGAHSSDSQKILNQVSAARVTLLDPDKKAQYDSELKARLPKNKPIPAGRPLPVMPVVMQVPPAAPLPPPPTYAATQPVAPQSVAPSFAPDVPSFGSTSGGSYSARRRKPSGGGVMGIIKVVVGSTGGIAIALLLLWIGFRSDPFSLFGPKDNDLAVNTVPGGDPTDTTGKDPVTEVIPAATTNTGSTTDTSATGSGTGANPSDAPKSGTTTPGTADNDPASKTGDADPTTKSDDPLTGSGTDTPSSTGSNTGGTSTTEPRGDLSDLVNSTPESTDVPKSPVPSTEIQKAKLAEVKVYYKADFDNGAKPANRPAFIDFLIATAQKLKSDPAAQFVLLREAYDKALLDKDYVLAADLVDELERGFEMDPLKLRLHVLTQASSAAKAPAARTVVMTCASELVDYALKLNQLAEAQKLSKIAEGHARSLGDSQLKAKILATAIEIEKRAAEIGPVERARQTLVANPNDPAANLVVGKYLCLFEGDWSAGLMALVKGDDAQLAEVAQQDIAGPTADFTAVMLGDIWFEIAKSNSSLTGFYRRAEHWYQLGAKDATGLEQVRVQQRLEQIAAMSLPAQSAGTGSEKGAKLPSFAAMLSDGQSLEPVDLFTKIPAQQPRGNSGWAALPPHAIDSDSTVQHARVQTSYMPPREYQLTLRVRRPQTTLDPRVANDRMGPLVIGLVGGRSQFLAVLDFRSADGGYSSFLTLSSAKSLADNPTLQNSTTPLVGPGKISLLAGGLSYADHTITCQVRRRSVTVSVDGRLACQFEGDLGQLSVPREWAISDPKVLFLGSHLGDFRVNGWAVEPLPALATAGAFGAPGLAP